MKEEKNLVVNKYDFLCEEYNKLRSNFIILRENINNKSENKLEIDK